MTTTTAPANPVALQNRAARYAERIARQQRIAEQRAAEAAEAAVRDEQAPADDWDTPAPYALTEAAASALSAPSADEQDDQGAAIESARTVALSPVALHALAAAVKGATAHPSTYTPVLEVARVTLADGALSIVATDRYRVHRLTVPAVGAADAVGFIRPADLTAVARALAPAAARRGDLGAVATVSVTVDPDDRAITWDARGARHTTTWEEMTDYPPVDRFLDDVDADRAPVAEWHANPRYMGAAMTAAAAVADANAPVRVSADAPAGNPQSAMIRVSAGEQDSPAGLFEACVMSVRA